LVQPLSPPDGNSRISTYGRKIREPFDTACIVGPPVL
jgi:hypothetical protein